MTASNSAAIEPVSGNTSRTHPINNAYFPALDGFRAVAFLLVFGVHYASLPWGFTGVDAFFVLSGFLITGILFDTRNSPHRAYNFYLRRTLRIFPLYYGIFLLLAATYPIFRWDWNWTWLLWPAYLGNFARFFHPAAYGSPLQMMADAQPLSRTFPHVQLYLGHFWSLCVEEQFYLFWPWIVFWVKDRRKLIAICIAVVILCPVLRALAPAMLPQFMIDQLVTVRATPYRLDALLLGGLIALLRRGPAARWLLPVSRVLFAVLLTGMILWHVFHHATWHSYRNYNYPPWAFSSGLTISEWLYASILVMTLEVRSIAFHMLNLRPLRWLGRISYGAYVFHDMLHACILRVVQHYPTAHPVFQTEVMALAITVSLSWFSFRFYESRFIRLKDRWTR